MKKALKKLNLKKLKDKRIKTEKKFLIRLSLFFVIAVLSYILVHEFGYYFELEESIKHNKQASAKLAVKKYDNIETKIFDLDPKNNNDSAIKIADLEDIAGYESKDYKAQLEESDNAIDPEKITELENEINDLKQQIFEIKQSGNNATLVSYVHLRQKIMSNAGNNMNFYEELKNFEILSLKDQFLTQRIHNLKKHLGHPLGHEYLINQFENLADKLTATKPVKANSKLLEKIYQNLSQIILVRKVKNTKENTIDDQLIHLQRALSHRQYIKANHILLAMDNQYKVIAANFIMDLNHLIAFHRLDNEILNYLARK